MPDTTHHADVLSGNDIIDGGDGDGLIIGDNLTVTSTLETGFKEIERAVKDVVIGASSVLHQLKDLSFDYDLAEHTILDVGHQHDIEIGNDNISGGAGNDLSITSEDVINRLSELFVIYGIPECIRSDNGPEFVAKAIQQWLSSLDVRTLYVAPGSPWQNGYAEIVGDNGRIVAPSASGFPVSKTDSTSSALAFHSLLRDIEHVTTDFEFVVDQAHVDTLATLVADAIDNNTRRKKPKKHDIIDPDHHDLIIGNDVIDGGSGNDLVVGDDGIIPTPVVTSSKFRKDRTKDVAIEKDIVRNTTEALKDQKKLRDDLLKNHVKDNHDDFNE